MPKITAIGISFCPRSRYFCMMMWAWRLMKLMTPLCGPITMMRAWV